MGKRIEIVIDKKTGDVRLEVFGLKGKACLLITRELEEALGLDEGDRVLKNEFYLSEEVGSDNVSEVHVRESF